jgi:hypothetical protein
MSWRRRSRFLVECLVASCSPSILGSAWEDWRISKGVLGSERLLKSQGNFRYLLSNRCSTATDRRVRAIRAELLYGSAVGPGLFHFVPVMGGDSRSLVRFFNLVAVRRRDVVEP